MKNAVKLTRNDIRKIIREVITCPTNEQLLRESEQNTSSTDVVGEFVARVAALWEHSYDPEDVSMDGIDQNAWDEEVQRAIADLDERVRAAFDDVKTGLSVGDYS